MTRINFDVRQLQALIAIAEEGSFSAAATRICLSQPALSQLIKQLESSLELRLFHRTTRRVELTLAGQSLLATARRIIGEFDEAVSQLRDYADCRSGKVAVAALPSLAATLLAESIPEFRRQHPGVLVAIRDGVAVSTVDALRAGEVDFALGLPVSDDRELIATELLHDELIAIAHCDSAHVRAQTLEWTTLATQAMIAMAPGTSIRRLTDETFTQLKLAPRVAYEVAYMTTAYALVENGEGIAILPSSAVPQALPGTLRVLRLTNPRVERTICIIERRGRHRSPATQRFIEHLGTFAQTWRQPGVRASTSVTP